jgi:phage terminase Nu1 subunit (DNA packaging protein)
MAKHSFVHWLEGHRAFFGEAVRTVQRWEALGLTIHRPGGDKNVVFADPDEFARWALQVKPHD